MTDANLKITIITKDNNLVDFLVQAELDMNIYTEKPIDENSEFNDGELGDGCEAEPFYCTSINDLLEKYKSLKLTKIIKIKG